MDIEAEPSDPHAEDECRGHAQPVHMVWRAAALTKHLAVDLAPHPVEGHVALVGWRVVGACRVLQQIVEPIAAVFGHDSYSLAKSASASRSCDRAADRRLLHVPSATPRTAAISVWVYPSRSCMIRVVR